MRIKRKYRIAPVKTGWQAQYRFFGIWLQVDNSGPFGYNGGWISQESAIDMLAHLMNRRAFQLLPHMRVRRGYAKRKALGPLLLPLH